MSEESDHSLQELFEKSTTGSWDKVKQLESGTVAGQSVIGVLTFAGFFVVRKDKKDKLKVVYRFPWISATSIKLGDTTNEILMDFSGHQITFVCANAERLYNTIFAHLKAMLPENFVQLVPELSYQPFRKHHSTMKLAHNYVSYMYQNNEKVDGDVVIALGKSEKRGKVKLDRTMRTSSYRAVLAALKLGSSIRTLDITATKEESWDDLRDIVRTTPGLKSLNISYFKGLTNFPDFIATVGRSKIQSLSFKHTEFEEAMADAFQELTSSNVQRISFTKWKLKKPKKDRKGSQMTVNTYSTTEEYLASLLRLKFDRLAITECNISPCSLLAVQSECIARALSIDVCEIREMPKTMPPGLRVLELTNVKWSVSALCSFLSSTGSIVELDLSDGHFDSERELIESFPEKPCPELCSFSWDRNPIFPRLCTFISQFTRVHTVNMCYCPVLREKETRKNFIQILKRVERLVCIGTLRSFSKKRITEFFVELTNNENLNAIDVSDNALEESGLEQLYELVKSNVGVEELGFDVIGLSKPKTLVKFFQKLGTIKHLKTVRCPYSEMRDLQAKDKKKEMHTEWKALQQQLINGQESLPELSWTFQIRITIEDSSEREWKALEDEFSLDRLLGSS